jgi:hypothetical protein
MYSMYIDIVGYIPSNSKCLLDKFLFEWTLSGQVCHNSIIDLRQQSDIVIDGWI